MKKSRRLMAASLALLLTFSISSQALAAEMPAVTGSSYQFNTYEAKKQIGAAETITVYENELVPKEGEPGNAAPAFADSIAALNERFSSGTNATPMAAAKYASFESQADADQGIVRIDLDVVAQEKAIEAVDVVFVMDQSGSMNMMSHPNYSVYTSPCLDESHYYRIPVTATIKGDGTHYYWYYIRPMEYDSVNVWWNTSTKDFINDIKASFKSEFPTGTEFTRLQLNHIGIKNVISGIETELDYATNMDFDATHYCVASGAQPPQLVYEITSADQMGADAQAEAFTQITFSNSDDTNRYFSPDNDMGCIDRMAMAKEQVTAFTEKVLDNGTGSRVGLVLFASKVLDQAELGTYKNLPDGFSYLYGHDGTQYTPALRAAAGLFPKAPVEDGRNQYVIFVTDGKADDDPENIRSQVTQLKDSGVTVYTVGISLSTVDFAFLQGLASASNCSANCKTKAEFAEVLNAIYADIEIQTPSVTDILGSSFLLHLDEAHPITLTYGDGTAKMLTSIAEAAAVGIVYDEGTKTFTWDMSGVDEDGMRLSFYEVFDQTAGPDLTSGKDTNQGATLSYYNSYTGQAVNTPIDTPAALTATGRISVLSAELSVNPDSAVEPGQALTYTITLQNTGDLDLEGISVVGPFPQGTAYVSGGTPNAAQDGVTFQVDSLPAGGTVTLTYTVQVTGASPVVTNTAQFELTGRTDAAGQALCCQTNTLETKVTGTDGDGDATEQYTLYFNSNGGSEIPSVTENKGSTVELNSYVPVWEGYTFAGWYADEALTQPVSSVTLEADQTVYAHWERDQEPAPDKPKRNDLNAIDGPGKPGELIWLKCEVSPGHDLKAYRLESSSSGYTVGDVTWNSETTSYVCTVTIKKQTYVDGYNSIFTDVRGEHRMTEAEKAEGPTADIHLEYDSAKEVWKLSGEYGDDEYPVVIDIECGEREFKIAEKKLEGKTLEAGEFHFTLTPMSYSYSNGTYTLAPAEESITLTNAANGDINVKDSVFTSEFDLKYKVGSSSGAYTYSFLLAEVDGKEAGYTYDTGSYVINLAFDSGGELLNVAAMPYTALDSVYTFSLAEAIATSNGFVGKEGYISFHNEYVEPGPAPEPTPMADIKIAEKELAGAELEAEQFSFELIPFIHGTDGYTLAGETEKITLTNDKNGNIFLDSDIFTEEFRAKYCYDQKNSGEIFHGAYAFLLREVNGGADGYTYDASSYAIDVTFIEGALFNVGAMPYKVENGVYWFSTTDSLCVSNEWVAIGSVKVGYVQFKNSYVAPIPVTNATVTFKVANGTWADGTAADKTVTVVLSGGTGTLAGTDVPTGMRANSGYTGGSWNVTPNNAENGITGDVTYTYTFTRKSSGDTGGTTHYTLSFESNGGSGINSITRPYGTVISLNQYKPARDGYAFDGWYTDETLQQEASSITLKKDTTIYAKWIQKTINEDGTSAELNSADHIPYVVGYLDGTVRPNDNITRAEVTSMFYRLLTNERRSEIYTTTNRFADVSNDMWCNKAISSMAAGGYVTGYADGSFGPDKAITRAEFVAIAARFVNHASGSVSLNDVPESHWAYEAIATAVANEWIAGYKDDTFRPDQRITRAEAMTIINRMLNRGVDEDGLMNGYKVWPDSKPGAWYYYEVIEATNDHEYTGSRPSEDWTSLEADYEYDREHFEAPNR